MIRRPPRSTLSSSSAASDVYKRQGVLDDADTLASQDMTGDPLDDAIDAGDRYSAGEGFGTTQAKPGQAGRASSGWPKSKPRTMLTTPPGTRTGTETGTVTAVPMRRPGDWSPTTRGPARIAPARRWPPSPRATPVDAPPRRPPCMFATATDLPHPKHREWNHDARSSSWTLSDAICLAPKLVCLLYTSDAADEEDSVDLGGRRIIKKK